MNFSRASLRLGALLFTPSLILAGAVNPGHPPVDRSAYDSFAHSLRRDEKQRHALERLTFGARPGDLAILKAEGLRRWLEGQLHPETLPENPDLATRLAPLETLNLSVKEAYERYPPPQMVIAMTRGGQQNVADQSTIDPGDDSDPRTPLTSILTNPQMQTLHHGNAEERRTLLASIPASRYETLVWALRRNQRRLLAPLAPPELRRHLMLAVNPQTVIASDLTEGKILRAVYSTHQLQELLVDFWFNHFNVFLDKGADRYFVPTYEREAIRPHVFGRFYDLLLATAESPAMLFYLDNWQSVGADSPRAHGGKNQRGLNENYGRELLELHTVGVDGGYSQQDVIEVARCFTGWTIANPRQNGEFEYNDRMHDKGRKIVLGHEIPAGGGMNDGLEVLNLLAHHPATAHFVSLQLAKRFVADDPPPGLVKRMSRTFLAKDGDLREVIRTMINSPEFWSAGAYRAKVKTPFEMVVSAVRASPASLDSAMALASEIQKLGEPLYRKIEPTGYSSANAEWISSGSLLQRMNFAIAFAHNRVEGVRLDTATWQSEARGDPMQIAHTLLDADPSASTREAIEKAIENPDLQKQLTAGAQTQPPQLPSLIAGLTLGSPEFQKR